MDSVAHVIESLPRFDPANATFSAKDIRPANVIASIEQFGCAWIKGLFDPAGLRKFDAIIAANIDGIENVYRALGFGDEFNIGFPLYFAAEVDPIKRNSFSSSYPGVFDPAKMDGVDTTKLANFIFAALNRCGLTKPIGRYLGLRELCTSPLASFIKTTSSMTKRRKSSHFGFRSGTSTAECLVWSFCRFSLDDHLPTVSACGIDNNLFKADAFWRPAYELGDAMLLSGFVPHRTFIEPGMTQARTSVDFRFFASAVPNPIYARPTVSKIKKRQDGRKPRSARVLSDSFLPVDDAQ